MLGSTQSQRNRGLRYLATEFRNYAICSSAVLRLRWVWSGPVFFSALSSKEIIRPSFFLKLRNRNLLRRNRVGAAAPRAVRGVFSNILYAQGEPVQGLRDNAAADETLPVAWSSFGTKTQRFLPLVSLV